MGFFSTPKDSATGQGSSFYESGASEVSTSYTPVEQPSDDGSSFFDVRPPPADYTVVDSGSTDGSFFGDGAGYTQVNTEGVETFRDEAEAAATSAESSSQASSASATAAAASAALAAAGVQAAVGTATPLMDGVADVGTGVKWAREDHVHPTDTSRASVTYVDAQDATLTTYVDAQDASLTTYIDAQDATLAADIALKAPLASPALTGTPTAPTAASSDDSTQIATTAYVKSNFGAWTAYTPSAVPFAGAFGSASATGRYLQVGKTVFFNLTVTITSNGTGSGAVVATLPVACKSVFVFLGREDAVTGAVFQAKTAAGTQNVNMFTFSNTYPGGNGYQLVISGTYEAN